MTSNVIGHVMITREAESYVGGKLQSLAIVEVKVPPHHVPERGG
jgi:hypothetical protein